MKNRAFAASAYLFFVPAIYIVLSSSRQKPFIGDHGAQALHLWIYYFLIFFGMRLLMNTIWMFYYLPLLEYIEVGIIVILAGYCLFSALRAYRGQTFTIPH